MTPELRKSCEHGRYEAHWKSYDRPYPENDWCLGGSEPSNDDLIAELERRGVVGFVEWVIGEPYRR